jgi:hypothetical protein
MSKKKLNTSSVLNELTGRSRYFEPSPQPTETKAEGIPAEESPSITSGDEAQSNHDTMTPRYHDTAMVETVRKALMTFGKEAATHRFTPEEKQGIAEIIFAFRQENIRTSENEIARISINWLILDYQQHKDDSVLYKVLLALNS